MNVPYETGIHKPSVRMLVIVVLVKAMHFLYVGKWLLFGKDIVVSDY